MLFNGPFPGLKLICKPFNWSEAAMIELIEQEVGKEVNGVSVHLSKFDFSNIKCLCEFVNINIKLQLN